MKDLHMASAVTTTFPASLTAAVSAVSRPAVRTPGPPLMALAVIALASVAGTHGRTVT